MVVSNRFNLHAGVYSEQHTLVQQTEPPKSWQKIINDKTLAEDRLEEHIWWIITSKNQQKPLKLSARDLEGIWSVLAVLLKSVEFNPERTKSDLANRMVDLFF